MIARWDEVVPRFIHDAKALLRAPAVKTQLVQRKLQGSDAATVAALEAVIEGHRNLERFFNRVSALQEAMRTIPTVAPRGAEVAILSARLATKTAFDAAGGIWETGRIDDCAIAPGLDNILIELLDNSLRFRRDEERPYVCVSAVAKSETLCVEYTDNSRGWDPAYTIRILRPFETLDPERAGFGLGLAIAAALAERNGGALRATPEAAGCRFEIELPIA